MMLEIALLELHEALKKLSGNKQTVCEVLLSAEESYLIKGKKVPSKAVKAKITSLSTDDIEYVATNMYDRIDSIKNKKSYIIADLCKQADFPCD
ncbi:MAG: hypothetical protein LUE12_07780 [Ruminococcus sp.]|nr:hypothetical protein [Ruminococcus sp.]